MRGTTMKATMKATMEVTMGTMMQPDYRRLLTTIRCEEPDRVPLAELGVDRPIKEAVLGRPVVDMASNVAFWQRAGYDYIYLRPGYEYYGVPGLVASGTVIADAYSAEQEAESVSSMHEGVIRQLADLETYPWPEPATVDYSGLAQAAGLLPAGMGIISGVGGIFTRCWLLMGFEAFSYALADRPELIGALFNRIGAIQCDVLRRVVKMDEVFAIWYGDDLAYTEALMISARHLRRYLFPWLEELMSIAREAGLPFIMHSDGRLYDILDDLLAMGLNALHPIEPKAMDIVDLKARYGRRLALFGNIDMGSTLVRGTPADVRAEVRQRIKDLAPGGGYAVSSSNSIARYVPVENYRAMLEATFEYGRYPIQL
jgi:uroporphyrinogen decarboxylase